MLSLWKSLAPKPRPCCVTLVLLFWAQPPTLSSGLAPLPCPPNLITQGLTSLCVASPPPSSWFPLVLLPPCSPFSDPVHWSLPAQWSPHNTTPAGWVCTRGCLCIVSGQYLQWSREKKADTWVLAQKDGKSPRERAIEPVISGGGKALYRSPFSSCF